MTASTPAMRLSIATALAFAIASPGMAQPSEQAVKAAFLPKIVRYITWPPQAMPAGGAPITLCILGSDPFGRMIDDAVSGQVVEQRPMTVRRIVAGTRVAGCNVAFVRGANAQATARLLAGLHGLPVLTVTDSRNGEARGMIHFAMKEGRVSFHIDDAMAADSNLVISSRLLAIALSVRQRRA